MHHFHTTWAERLKAEWLAETATAYDETDAIDFPVTLQEQVFEAMLVMGIDMDNGNRDNLAYVNELNAAIWEQVKPGPGPVSVDYWLMTVEYLGY